MHRYPTICIGLLLAVVLFANIGSAQAAKLKRCSPIILAEQGGGNFTDIRVARVKCPVAHGVLARYLRAESRCVPEWRCAYGVKVPWSSSPRIRFARRGGYRIFFNTGSV